MQRASIYNLLFYAVIPHLIPSRFISDRFQLPVLGRWIYIFRLSVLGRWIYGFRLSVLGLWIGIGCDILGLWIDRASTSDFWFPLRFLLNKWFSFGLYLMSRFNFKIIWMSG
ncbi:unnamed protein product [Rhizophagus irregularis]|nr:unnamed protein product [Rhizophagus irregularis]CAB4416852.1 unnamed protein product [Rhizophagus irregularis]